MIQPYLGNSNTARGKMRPYATTTIKSGAKLFNCSKVAGSFIFCGWKTGTPFSAASTFTGGGVSTILRPCGLSGWVNTPTTLWGLSSRVCRHGTAKSGVPINTIRSVCILVLLYCFIHTVNKKHTVQVVDLMAECPGL